MIRWFARNDIAANILLFGILAWGLWSAVEKVPLEEEIETRVKRIRSFPDEIVPPEVSIPDSAKWFDVIKLAVCGEMSEVRIAPMKNDTGRIKSLRHDS